MKKERDPEVVDLSAFLVRGHSWSTPANHPSGNGEPGVPRQEWQHAKAIRIESRSRAENLMPR